MTVDIFDNQEQLICTLQMEQVPRKGDRIQIRLPSIKCHSWLINEVIWCAPKNAICNVALYLETQKSEIMP